VDGSPSELIENPSFAGRDDAAAKAQLREQNRAADGDLMEWPEFTVRWKTRRGWPTPYGWAVAAVPTCILLVALSAWLAHGRAAGGPWLDNVAIGAAAMGIAVGLVAFVPELRQRETANWSLRVSSTCLQLEKESPGRERRSAVIRRVDAGKLELRTSEWMRRHGPQLVWASGSSIDGETTIALSDAAASIGPLGFPRPGMPLAHVLVSWWPANSRSVSALLAFEELRRPYWHPDGVPARPRSSLRRDL
jgi:hypothetical protein